MKKYNVMSNQQFRKANIAQKRSVILKSMSSVLLGEASLAFATTGALTCDMTYGPVVPALLFTCTAITAGMTYIAAKDAINDNNKNTKFVDNRIKQLNDELYETQNLVLARK